MQWNIIVDGGRYWAEYGQVDGKIQSDTPTVCEGKNIGRANETTPDVQAAKEAKSKEKKQLDMKGYHKSVDDVDNYVFKPTLAHKYKDHHAKLPDRMLVSPKLDGVRAYFTRDGAYSRNNLQWKSTEFIERTLRPIFDKYPDMVLDGELYNHKYHDNFNKISSLIKRKKNFTENHWFEIENLLEYHVFDVFIPSNPDASSEVRYNIIQKLFGSGAFYNVVCVKSAYVSKSEYHDLYERYMQQGYEGIMMRDPAAPYECKRSYSLLKYKEFLDEEFVIVGVNTGIGDYADACATFELELDGKSFPAKPKGDMEYFREIYNNQSDFIGKLATCRYQNLTPKSEKFPNGVPRFCIVHSIRDYE
tara:strand:+ start:99682 stop:100761 length:1080 start_codon:yes stop_codon:yes gene_type:complete